jgi:hypothetical protein
MRLLRFLLVSLFVAVGFLGTVIAGPASAQAPGNDTFATATAIPSLPFSDSVNTTDATTDSDDTEVGAACGFSGGTATVWYAYTPPSDQTVFIDTSGSSYPAGVGVVTGAPGSFTAVSCLPGSGTFSAVAGQTYYLDVADVSGGSGGTLNISVSVATPPEVQLSVNRSGRFDPRSGAATVSGTVTCTAGASGELDLSLSQAVGRVATISGFNFTELSCDGTMQPWSLSIQPFSGKFKGGHATVIADAFVCNAVECASDHVERTIQLRG